MIVLLFIIGSLMIGFLHLIIPLCVVKSKQIFIKKSTIWLIAIAGGLLGFIVCAIMQEEFRGLAGILQSAFWTFINYLILKKKCYV